MLNKEQEKEFYEKFLKGQCRGSNMTCLYDDVVKELKKFINKCLKAQKERLKCNCGCDKCTYTAKIL